MSKPIAVINTEKLANTLIDQPKKLHEAGYLVIFANDGPAIMLHQAAPGRRERIATALLAAEMSRETRFHLDVHVAAALEATDALIKELNK